jgi:hypothetical protein
MGRKRLCRVCGGKKEGPDYMKTKVALPPETDCPECEEFRNRGSRLTFVKVYVCPNCEKVTTIQMTAEEIKEHRFDFHWGSSDITPTSKVAMVKRAKKAQKKEEKSERITEEIFDKTVNTALDKLEEKWTELGFIKGFSVEQKQEYRETAKSIAVTPLQAFINKLTQCPEVHRVYLADPPNFAPHLVEKGWIIYELHIVPVGRPPYFKIEAIFGEVEKEGDAISEMIGDRVFLKITDKIHLVRIIESAYRLGHI